MTDKCCFCGNVRLIWDYMEYAGCDIEAVCKECYGYLGYDYFISLGYDYANEIRIV